MGLLTLSLGLLACHHASGTTEPVVTAPVEAPATTSAEESATPGEADPAEAVTAEDQPAEGEPVAREAEKKAMVRLLSGKDGAPDCVAVEALSPQPLEDLSFIVERVQQPPWAGMRAAHCVIEGYERLGGADAVDNLLRGWVKDPDQIGLGLLVLSELDTLPQDIAVTVARDAVHAGPVPDKARERVAKSDNEAVSAVAKEFPPPGGI